MAVTTVALSHVLCPLGKEAFESKAEAKRSKARMRARGEPVTRVYRCQLCSLWHTTSRGRR